VAVGVLAQAGLGVATLMAGAPVGLSIAHQVLAAFILALGVAFAWRVRRV
jgi:heme A synthase